MTGISATTFSLGTKAPESDREKLAGVAKQFEAIFVRQMLAAARKTSFDDGMFGGQAMETFKQMQDDQFADITAKTGTLGLATQIEAQLSRFLPQTSATPAAATTAKEA